MTKVLIIGYVWPEPASSAAGVRTWSLIDAFRQRGWGVTVSSGSKENEFTERIRAAGIAAVALPPNDPTFDSFIAELKPDYVIFDRFVTEEQFGWRVAEHSPESVRVVDTQDLHFLRRAREKALRDGAPLERIFAADLELETEDALRELAAIYRSDLSLVLSDFELTLLRKRFEVPDRLLALHRFSLPAPGPSTSWSERDHFVMLGNFRHPPNADGVRWLKYEIWPEVRARLPRAEVHVYGAYPSREMMDLSDPSRGFVVEGPAPNAIATLARYRVNLAPLRFGAGIKGKIADGWSAGTPAVTTPIGAEGMRGAGEWGGLIASDARDLAEAAVSLHSDERAWERARAAGRTLLAELFDRDSNDYALITRLEALRTGLSEHRRANIVGAMLRHHAHQSTKYFSRWIEAKNRA